MPKAGLNLVSQQIKYTVCQQSEPGEMKDGLVVFIHSPDFLCPSQLLSSSFYLPFYLPLSLLPRLPLSEHWIWVYC